MENVMKRFLSLALALLMVVSMLPVSALAAEDTEEEVVPDGSISNPYVYDSVDALVADWTERTVGAGEIICVQAPLGGETLTITSDTGNACIANPRSYGAYAYDSEPFTFDEYWTEGEVIVIGIYNQNHYGEAVVTLVSGAVEDGGDDDDTTTTTTALTMGNNSINAEDVTFTYTAAEDGVLTLSLGVAIMGDVSAQVYVSGKESEAVTLNVSSSLDLAMSSGETAYIAFTAARPRAARIPVTTMAFLPATL